MREREAETVAESEGVPDGERDSETVAEAEAEADRVSTVVAERVCCSDCVGLETEAEAEAV